MKAREWNIFGLAIAVALTVTLVRLPDARGELVYEEPATQESAAKASDRATLRRVIESSEKAQNTVNSQTQQAPQTVQAQAVHVTQLPQVQSPQVQVVPMTTPVLSQPQTIQNDVGAQTEPAVELQNLSKAELMRRERVREELRNEDILQERLEELRLRDEKKRTDMLLGSAGATGSAATQAPQGVVPMKEEVVVAPVTEKRPQEGVQPVQPTMSAPGLANATGNSTMVASAVDQSMQPQPMALAVVEPKGEGSDKTVISVQPRGGMSDMVGAGGYDVMPHYSLGVGVGVGVGDQVGFEIGYGYSEYGIAVATSNPFVAQYQALTNRYGYSSNLETVALKQNIGEAGVRLYLLNQESKLRPFIGGGGAYSKSFLNYDQRVIDYAKRNNLRSMGRDYELSSFLGTLSTGFDVKISKSISFGAIFKYYAVLSSRENQNLNNTAFYGGYPQAYYPNGVSNPSDAFYGQLAELDKQTVGGSLARSSFYSVHGGVTFTF